MTIHTAPTAQALNEASNALEAIANDETPDFPDSLDWSQERYERAEAEWRRRLAVVSEWLQDVRETLSKAEMSA